ncbi:MAG: glutaredoxin domain-containing protein [Ornithinimicrobium sp.]
MQRWLWLFVLASSAWAGLTLLSDGAVWTGALMLVVGLALAWWISPWRGGRSVRHREVMARPSGERAVVVYWRPGCSYCARLRRSLGARAEKAIWVNIWQDAEASEFVRQHNAGNETVPTVVIDGEIVTNPEPDAVFARLGG